VCLLVLQNLSVLLDWGSSVEHGSLDVWHVLAETGILVLNLVSQLTSVAHNQDRCLARDRFDLLKGSQHENRGFSETRFGLAKDVGAEDCLWNAYLLDCRVNRADVRSQCLTEGFEDVQGIATSVHLRNMISKNINLPKKSKHRSRGVTSALKGVDGQPKRIRNMKSPDSTRSWKSLFTTVCASASCPQPQHKLEMCAFAYISPPDHPLRLVSYQMRHSRIVRDLLIGQSIHFLLARWTDALQGGMELGDESYD
jgi:hypothetical protein